MNSHEFLIFPSPQTAQDLFLQTLSQGEVPNDDYFFFDQPAPSATVLEKRAFCCQCQLSDESNSFRAVCEGEEPYFLVPDSYEGDELFNEAQSSGVSAPVLSPSPSQQARWKCPYAAETRSIKIARYMDKKQRRNWNRKFQYFSRKALAHNRQRIKGRFVKNSWPLRSDCESSNEIDQKGKPCWDHQEQNKGQILKSFWPFESVLG